MLTMKKNKIKTSLVLASCLFGFALTGGLIAGTTVSADTTVSVETFSMVQGASIYTGTDNGIRFTGEIAKDEFDSWKDGKTIEAGTFVMPYSYWSSGNINEFNCFDPEGKYWWTGKGEEKGDKTQIIHIPASVTSEAKASRTGSGELVYQVNGSVIKIKDVNLARKYIGVSYLKVDGEYHFAKTSADVNSRSTVGVAQNILLANDANYTGVATGYINQYLTANGGSVTKVLSTEVYVNCSTGYEKYTNVTIQDENVTLDSVEDFKTLYGTAPDASLMEGYSLVVNGNGVNSTAIRVDDNSDNTLKFFYDKNLDSAMLFDGSLGATEAEVYAANDIESIDSGNAGKAKAGAKFSSDWGYLGGNSLWFDDFYGQNNGDIAIIKYSKAQVFPVATNKLSFMIKTNETLPLTSDFPTVVYVKTEGGKNQYWGAYRVGGLGLGEIAEITVEFKESFSSISEIGIFCQDSLQSYTLNDNYPADYVGTWPKNGNVHCGEHSPYYIDCIKAEIGGARTSEFANVEITDAEQTSTAVNVLEGVSSNVFSDRELANKTTATYVELPGTESTSISVTDGVLTIPVAQEETYKVNVNYGDSSSSFYVFGYYPFTFATFENTEFTYVQEASPDGVVSTEQAMHGNSSLYLNGTKSNFATCLSDAGNTKVWFSGSQGGTLAVAYKTLCMWIYAPTARTLTAMGTDDIRLTLKGNGTWAWGAGATMFSYINFNGEQLQAGWNYVEFTLPTINIKTPNKTNDFDVDGAIGYYTIMFWTKQSGVNTSLYGCYIDRIAFKGPTTSYDTNGPIV